MSRVAADPQFESDAPELRGSAAVPTYCDIPERELETPGVGREPDHTVRPPHMRESDWIVQCPGRWWVVHTRARSEKVVAEALARERVPNYLPLAIVRRTYAKSKVCFHVPLFPGYVFLCGDHSGCDVARRTKRVANVLTVIDQDCLRHELAHICRAIESGEMVGVHPALQAGQRCRIIGGPLKGMEGVAVGDGRRWRMHLAVTMLGQSAVIEVDAALLEVLD